MSTCCTRPYKRPVWLPPPRGLAALLGGFIIHFSLGSLYSHGNISTYVISFVRNYSHPRDLTDGTTAWLYGAAVMGQGVSVCAGGLLEMKLGPRYTALVGSVLMSAGVMLSAAAIKVSFWLLMFTYGVLFGVGSGIAYIAPIVCILRWLPKWKGFTIGVGVSGVGLGALLFDLAQMRYLNPDLENLEMFMHSDTEDSICIKAGILLRVPTSFLIFGAVYMVMQLIGCALLTNPPKRQPRLDDARYRHGSTTSAVASLIASDLPSSGNPESSLLSTDTGVAFASNPAVASSKPADEGVEMEMIGEHEESRGWTTNIISSVTPLKMLKTINFYHLWVVFLLNEIALACIITMYKIFAQTVICDDLFITTAGSVASIFNFVGRLFWGLAADLFTFKLAIVCLCAVTTVLALTLYATLGVKAVFFIWVCAIFFCVGGSYVLFATGVARSYGPKYFGVNYGLLFSAQLVVGVVSSVLSSSTVDWSTFFFLASAFSALAFVLMMFFRNKRYILTR